MTMQAFDLPKTFDGQVPLFPLSDLVMFPSNLLPLHIFESRYREMMEHAVQGLVDRNGNTGAWFRTRVLQSATD